MYFIINGNKLYSLIIVLITATTVFSSPQTFHIQKFDDPNPNKLPPSIQLYHGLSPGVVISVITSHPGRTIRFDIFDVYGNRVLRVEPRPEVNALSLNTYFNGWGTEITTQKFPSLKPDEKYCLHIAYDTHGYRIFLNGEAVYFFKHRSTNNGSELVVEGTGKVFLMSYKLNEPKWAIQQTENAVYSEEFGDDGIHTPYVLKLQGTNQLSSIAITGIISANAPYVAFNLMNNVGEILFHFKPRFTDNIVVRNSYLEGKWGQDETSGGMVLQRNQNFTLAIDVEVDYFKTYINGEDFVTYEHRIPAFYTDITKLDISSNMKLSKIMYYK